MSAQPVLIALLQLHLHININARLERSIQALSLHLLLNVNYVQLECIAAVMG